MKLLDTREGARIRANMQRQGHWNRWGPYLAERAWGTVREDYSTDGDAWDFFPHDHARSRTYRWNEDGLGGISDRYGYLCFALALWNGRDPILKERAFGLNNHEGNHGEDVKEYYYYLDNVPSHAYMRFRYKYPQAAYPYEQLIAENARRDRTELEYELIDTGVFDQSRYFDVDITYAKAEAEALFIEIAVSNRGPEPAPITIVPTLWFRNTWAWGWDDRRPMLREIAAYPEPDSGGTRAIEAQHWFLGRYALQCEGADELLFTENETNTARCPGLPASSPYVKDAFHRYLVDGEHDAVNPERSGTKAAAVYRRTVAAGATVTLRLRLASLERAVVEGEPFADFDATLDNRRAEADEFYGVALPAALNEDARRIARQAFAGLLWSKQFYHYVVLDWLNGDPSGPPPPAARRTGRNARWQHVFARDVISMPDTWEFPWFAAWDLGFHCITLAYVDPQFAKDQITLMLREWYMNEDGQVPAYEWDFGDVSPPVLAFCALAVARIEQAQCGTLDREFLTAVFHKMLISFTWWANRKDARGNDIFQGGFLGLDNIGPFDRDALPPDYLLGQVDGTAWMASFANTMFELSLLLAQQDPAFEGVAIKFWDHFLNIANAMNGLHRERTLWDEEDGFFYDTLRYPDGRVEPVRARSLVGFTPFFHIVLFERTSLEPFADFTRHRDWYIQHRPDMVDSVGPIASAGSAPRGMMSLLREDQLRRMLEYMLDENEFLSPYGVRSLSRYHRDHPVVVVLDGVEHRLDYEPGESTTALFGGNSNWRGPIWMPVNFLLLEGLEGRYRHYGDALTVECPTGSGQLRNLHEVAVELAGRLLKLFLRGSDGRRPVNGPYAQMDADPHWRDCIAFHEFFHGETGRGCGASHQTGWTGLIAAILVLHGPEIAAATG